MTNAPSEQPRGGAANDPTAKPPVIEMDESKLVTSYANFCRVTGTPEELIVDFGLNTQPNPVPGQPIAVTQRIVVNYFTAKRMLAALHMSLQRHEATFGAVETDVQKRVVSSSAHQRDRT